MLPHHRRLIFWCFLALFVLLAPVIILYTAGYRYNWQRGKMQETGVLVAAYRPTDAILSLNDEKRAERSPLRIAGLLPARYTITAAKDGYHPWKKRLWVEPSKTTFVQHVVLWRHDPPQTRFNEEEPVILAPSAKNDLLAVVTREKPTHLQLIDANTAKLQQTFAVPSKGKAALSTVLWSPKGKRIVVGAENGGQFVFAVKNGDTTMVPLSRFVTNRLEDVRWNMNDDDRLYGFRRTQKGYELTEIDLFRGAVTASPILFKKRVPYTVEDDMLYRIENDALFITPFAAQRQALERRLPLPRAMQRAQFIPGGPDTVLTLLDPVERQLFLIDKETRTLYPIQETIEGVNAALWSSQYNRLLWNTGKELWLLDLEHSTRELMVRGKEKIHAMAWDPESEYIFSANGEVISVTEIDNRGERNQVALAAIPSRKGLVISADGNTLWAIGEVEGKMRLLSLTVAER